jgi:hypothetical protein
MLIFHHLTKTGGTALRYALGAFYGEAFVELYETEERSRAWFRAWLDAVRPAEWARIRCIAAHHAGFLLPLLDEPPRVFTLVRDPVERVVSYYAYITGRLDAGVAFHPTAAAIRERGWTLVDIYRRADELHGDLLFGPFYNGQARAILASPGAAGLPFEPVAPEDVPLPVATLERTLDALYLLGAQERHAESVAMFAQAFGWGDLRTGRHNVTASRLAVAELPPGDVAMIRAFNQVDAALHARALRSVGTNGAAPA